MHCSNASLHGDAYIVDAFVDDAYIVLDAYVPDRWPQIEVQKANNKQQSIKLGVDESYRVDPTHANTCTEQCMEPKGGARLTCFSTTMRSGLGTRRP